MRRPGDCWHGDKRLSEGTRGHGDTLTWGRGPEARGPRARSAKERVIDAGGGWRETFSGLRSRQSGIRYGLSGSGTGSGPEPVPGAEDLNQAPDGRDLGPEIQFRFPFEMWNRFGWGKRRGIHPTQGIRIEFGGGGR